MPTESAGTVVLSADRRQVLLVKREDFRVWVTPGGGIEPGESPEQAAIRETCEETGYQVAIDRLIGRYWCPQTRHGGNLMHLFEARVIGGAPISSGPETAAVEFFPVDELPSRVIQWVPSYVADALLNSPDVIERTEYLPFIQFVLIRIGLVIRDLRNKYILHRK